MLVPAAAAAAAGSALKQAGVASPAACSTLPCMLANRRCLAEEAEERPPVLPLPSGLPVSAGSCTAAARLARPEANEARVDCWTRSPCCSCATSAATAAAAAASGTGDAASLPALLLGSCRPQPSAAVAGSRAAGGSWQVVAAAPAAWGIMQPLSPADAAASSPVVATAPAACIAGGCTIAAPIAGRPAALPSLAVTGEKLSARSAGGAAPSWAAESARTSGAECGGITCTQ